MAKLDEISQTLGKLEGLMEGFGATQSAAFRKLDKNKAETDAQFAEVNKSLGDIKTANARQAIGLNSVKKAQTELKENYKEVKKVVNKHEKWKNKVIGICIGFSTAGGFLGWVAGMVLNRIQS